MLWSFWILFEIFFSTQEHVKYRDNGIQTQGSILRSLFIEWSLYNRWFLLCILLLWIITQGSYKVLAEDVFLKFCELCTLYVQIGLAINYLSSYTLLRFMHHHRGIILHISEPVLLPPWMCLKWAVSRLMNGRN